jgi:hypothetical protein
LFAATGKKERNKVKDANDDLIQEYDYLQSHKTGKLYMSINVSNTDVEAYEVNNEHSPLYVFDDCSKFVVRQSTDFMFLASKPNWKG